MTVKVFHIIAHLVQGGSERVAINIVTSGHTNIEYHVVEVLRGKDAITKTLLSELKAAGIPVHRSCISHHKLGILFFPVRFLWLMLQYRPDIIHTHTEIPDIALYLWHRAFGGLFPKTSYIRTIHNTELWNSWKRIGQLVERLFQRKKANVAVGNSAAQSYLQEYGERVPVIFNGVQELTQTMFPGIVDGAVNVLFAGRMEKQKGISTLIQTVKHLKHHPNIMFHIVGRGALRAEVEHELRSLPTVRLYDRIPGLAASLGGMDYVFMPSEFEGLALFSLEASLAGVPVIANQCPGLAETLPPDWPLTAEANDVSTYARILTSPLSKEERAALIEKARTYVRQSYSLSSMRSSYEQLYLTTHQKATQPHN